MEVFSFSARKLFSQAEVCEPEYIRTLQSCLVWNQASGPFRSVLPVLICTAGPPGSQAERELFSPATWEEICQGLSLGSAGRKDVLHHYATIPPFVAGEFTAPSFTFVPLVSTSPSASKLD